MLIAIDGPSASGKGTIARKLATHFNLPYLDTGLLYRWVALRIKQQGNAPDDVQAATQAAHFLRDNINHVSFDDPELRGHAISQPSSVVAAMPSVREALVALQRAFAHQASGAVLDGRDIGTVIAPDAKIKLFITASAEKRAERRFKELQGKGQTTTYDDVLADLKARDARDESRPNAPSKMAEDAVRLDTSDLNVEEAFAAALNIVEQKRD